MKKYLNPNLKFLISIFIAWKLLLITVLVVSLEIFPVDPYTKFLGGGYLNYISNPYLFSWANFDGEHYLAISIFGYKALEHAFFPAYPLLINLTHQIFSYDLSSSWKYAAISGIIISNAFLIASLYIFRKLIELDFDKKISYYAVVSLLAFPTSFFLGAIYNESLFLFFTLMSFYMARKQNWLVAGIFGMLSSATRVMGIFLLPALLFDAYQQKSLKKSFGLLLIPFGLFSYMYYQFTLTGDPLAFYHLQTTIGEHRQSDLVLLPQVLFRYLKILTNVSVENPIFQTIVLEFLSMILFLSLLFYGYKKKIRYSYLIFGLLALLVSPLQGSLTSIPRYVLVVFPGFIAIAIYLTNLPKGLRWLIILTSISALVLESSLYFRGYWVG